MKMYDLCAGERPREKMLEYGPRALSNGELLAIIIRSGTRTENALQLSQRILAENGGKLGKLLGTGTGELSRIPGIGPCKAASLHAALELGRRFMAEESGIGKKAIVSARMAYDLLFPLLKGAVYEECWGLFLNAHNNLLEREQLTRGGSLSTTLDPGQIIRTALASGAKAIILAHNHPTGDPHPSNEDLRGTELLSKACEAVGIKLLDHIVVCDESFYSMADERMYLK